MPRIVLSLQETISIVAKQSGVKPDNVKQVRPLHYIDRDGDCQHFEEGFDFLEIQLEKD